jgi:hypothetical protein
MIVLADIPIIMKLAVWVWGNGQEGILIDDNNKNIGTIIKLSSASAKICINEFPYMLTECWTQVIAKGLGIAVIGGSFLNRAPIIHNIITSKSTEGLSRTSIYGDIVSKFSRPYNNDKNPKSQFSSFLCMFVFMCLFYVFDCCCCVGTR